MGDERRVPEVATVETVAEGQGFSPREGASPEGVATGARTARGDAGCRGVVHVTAFTNVGPARDRNEDILVLPALMSVGSMHDPLQLDYLVNRPLLFAVVDGMGGQQGGQHAARTVASELLERDARDVGAALAEVNTELYAEMSRLPALAGMGATIAGIVVGGEGVTVFNVGDSRVYQKSGGYLMLRSVDDRVSPESNVVTQSLGGCLRPTAISPHVSEIPLGDGERWLICSDGLSGSLSFEAIEAILGERSAPDAAAALFEAALAAGLDDNVSLVLLENSHE